VQGFFNAGKVVGAITRAEAISLIDEAHFSAFGMTNLVVPLCCIFNWYYLQYY
jgi:hypothetical protein